MSPFYRHLHIAGRADILCNDSLNSLLIEGFNQINLFMFKLTLQPYSSGKLNS